MFEESVAVEYKAYKDGDERKILDLFRATFGVDLPLPFWRWRQLDNPAGGPWTETAWDGDSLAGHYAVAATKMSINGEAVPTCLSMTTMVHSNYRGQGIFEKSAESIYSRLSDAGVRLVYGFPNVNSHRPFIQKLAWDDICDTPTFTLDVASGKPVTAPSFVEEVMEFDARFDALWGRVKGTKAIWNWRDSEMLTWRFLKNPVNKYRIAVATDNSEIRGYIIVKQYRSSDLDIVDIVADDKSALPPLVAWATQVARDMSLLKVNVWAPIGADHRESLARAGFQAGAPVTHFGGRALLPIDADFSDPRLWHYSMSDSDLY
jgi:Acetyltransferase (GNAT) domain